jgi:hypothetical protein
MYVHRGVVQENGFVDITKVIYNMDLLHASNMDYYHNIRLELGNVGIWYFDIMDLQNNCTIIIQFYFQTEPDKRELGLYGTMFTRTKEFGVFNRSQKYKINDLFISKDSSQISIKDNRIYTKYHPELDSHTFSLTAKIEDIRIQLEFVPQINGWKPFGDRISFGDNNRAGSFSVICLTPKAYVSGVLEIKNKLYEIEDAFGYHDHTVWKSTEQSGHSTRKLFIDDVMSKWEFGKFVSSEYVMIFDTLYLRPWLRQSPIKTFMFAQNNNIIHSSNNLITVTHYDMQTETDNQSHYPDRIIVELKHKDGSVRLKIKLREVIDKKEILGDLHFLARSLIGLFFGNPFSCYAMAETEITINGFSADSKNVNCNGLYELLVLNDRPTRFEDCLRKILHMTIK